MRAKSLNKRHATTFFRFTVGAYHDANGAFSDLSPNPSRLQRCVCCWSSTVLRAILRSLIDSWAVLWAIRRFLLVELGIVQNTAW